LNRRDLIASIVQHRQLPPGTVVEWDDSKRRTTLDQRNLDFADAPELLDGRPAYHQMSSRGPEERWKTTARVGAKLFTVVWAALEPNRLRIISMRRAHVDEERAYRELYGRGAAGDA
jgi:uncharacterized DUF497 family protein